jgi:hypothetical protein
MVFALYKELCAQTQVNPLTTEEKEYIITNIPLLSEQEHELIYAIIKTFHIDQSDVSDIPPFVVPFRGKRFKKGLRFDLEKLPLQLQCLLKSFVEKVQKVQKVKMI